MESRFETAGDVIGIIAAVITFLAVYAAAVGSVGWVIGIALGWIPAYLAGALAFVIFRFGWPLIALLLVLLGLAIFAPQ